MGGASPPPPTPETISSKRRHQRSVCTSSPFQERGSSLGKVLLPDEGAALVQPCKHLRPVISVSYPPGIDPTINISLCPAQTWKHPGARLQYFFFLSASPTCCCARATIFYCCSRSGRLCQASPPLTRPLPEGSALRISWPRVRSSPINLSARSKCHTCIGRTYWSSASGQVDAQPHGRQTRILVDSPTLFGSEVMRAPHQPMCWVHLAGVPKVRRWLGWYILYSFLQDLGKPAVG